MTDRKIFLFFDVLVYAYLFYVLNPAFAAAGHWFSWQGTGITVLVIIVATVLERSGFWHLFKL
ncbi:hypothetical protein [Lacticaseibacillus saniviri]|uniref:Uncharacterized protein n=1 Tax=Lacticaseibacillus saniviri JCM 17471 = DSM 24301 TaxID=1293598 RepID=A0A0R2MRT2_9LACO|nr:hypothetical protein [Lacticaseibacillus saniviri]KRO16303.1 hypothetical protein IV56_GL001664 [Lacticaseibacillus saniviri JCM 17471 = DSM 24301]MCG4281871.1 hypothetical protein [Lacticaseibacillus saniviri]